MKKGSLRNSLRLSIFFRRIALILFSEEQLQQSHKDFFYCFGIIGQQRHCSGHEVDGVLNRLLVGQLAHGDVVFLVGKLHGRSWYIVDTEFISYHLRGYYPDRRHSRHLHHQCRWQQVRLGQWLCTLPRLLQDDFLRTCLR